MEMETIKKHKYKLNKCPNCDNKLEELEIETEILLRCENCRITIDSDGGRF